MEFFVMVDGKLVPATQEQVLSPDEVLYNKDGEAINRPQAKIDPVEELTGIVKDLAVTVDGLSAIKETQEDLENKLAAYQDSAKKGFPIFAPDIPDGTSEEDLQKIIEPYNIKAQGKRLMDKLYHPGHVIDSEEKRLEMAKYFCLALKAGFMDDPVARVHFKNIYGAVKKGTTDIGDAGNVFPVPDIVDAEILAFARESSVVLQEARIWPMTSEFLSIPTEKAGVTTAWGNTTSESDPEIQETEITAKELSAYANVRNTTLADAQSDIVSWITEVMAEAAGQAIDEAAFNGTGDPTSGIFAKAGLSVVMASGTTTFAGMNDVHLSDMIGKLDGLRKQGAKFYMHGSIVHYVRILKDDNGNPIFVETVGGPQSGTIWGYPYREVIICPSTTAVDTPFVAFGNLRYLAVGRRADATALMIDPYGLWATNRTRFKIYQRWGIEVPNLYSATLSMAFVKLITAAS